MHGWKKVSKLEYIVDRRSELTAANTWLLVYRVNWLRAKARYDRWDEELTLVKSEMTWTLLFFDWHRKKWEERAVVSEMKGQRGEEAYAFKQAAMWEKFGTEGEKVLCHLKA
jgi:hypothetical protein